jgi:spore germination protein YaaH
VVFSSAQGIPESSDSEAAQELLEKATKFLTTNEELLNLLDTYGYNPFEQLKL